MTNSSLYLQHEIDNGPDKILARTTQTAMIAKPRKRYSKDYPVAELAHALAIAFEQDEFYSRLVRHLSSEGAKYKALERYFEFRILQSVEANCILSEGKHAVALWHPPKGRGLDLVHSNQAREELRKLVGIEGENFYSRTVARMAKQVPQYLVDEYYLSILAVHPNDRGQGFASRLLCAFMSRVRQECRRCYLETFNPKSLAVYRRAGFVNSKEIFEPIMQRNYWLLWTD